MFIIYTNQKQSTESYKKECKIADAHYNKTGEVVAVELSHPDPNPWRTLNNYKI